MIGGGYIGLETAAVLQMHGLDVTIVFPESRYLERLFTPELAAFYENFYAEKGIKKLPHGFATGFQGTDGAVGFQPEKPLENPKKAPRFVAAGFQGADIRELGH